MKPVWLLDVDGVLNANDPGIVWNEQHENGHASDKGRRFRMRWSPVLTARIAAIADRVDIRWCTTWCGATEQLAALFSLPEFPDAFTRPPYQHQVGERKAEAVVAVLDSQAPLIWTDDQWATPDLLHGLDASDILLIQPDEKYGLTPDDMDRIEEFVNKCMPL